LCANISVVRLLFRCAPTFPLCAYFSVVRLLFRWAPTFPDYEFSLFSFTGI
jgi:hypothetical protein